MQNKSGQDLRDTMLRRPGPSDPTEFAPEAQRRTQDIGLYRLERRHRSKSN